MVIDLGFRVLGNLNIGQYGLKQVPTHELLIDGSHTLQLTQRHITPPARFWINLPATQVRVVVQSILGKLFDFL